MLLRSIGTRSDTKDWFDRSWSTDNGATWGETREESFIREAEGGVERNYVFRGLQTRFATGTSSSPTSASSLPTIPSRG